MLRSPIRALILLFLFLVLLLITTGIIAVIIAVINCVVTAEKSPSDAFAVSGIPLAITKKIELLRGR
jgi:hypothetical protein